MIAPRRLTNALRNSTPARKLRFRQQAAFWLAELDPTLSLDQTRARVVRIVDETDDTKTFLLQPNRSWRGHRAGQYVSVQVEIDGVRVRRCYSIASAPHQRDHIAITVKRIPGGRVSTWLHDKLSLGDVVELGSAAGDFVLPTPLPTKLLLLSGGVGITPVMSILRDLSARDAIRDVVFVHYTRRRDSVIFGAELEALAHRHPGLRVCVVADDDNPQRGGFDEAHFAAQVEDYAERATFLCGPAALMDRAEWMWRKAAAAARVRRERFAPAPRPAATTGNVGGAQVELVRSARQVVARGDGSLLDQLERAGETPTYGCRMGICHTCKCRKRRGTVENLITGELSSDPDEDIQLCISAARSDLELEL